MRSRKRYLLNFSRVRVLIVFLLTILIIIWARTTSRTLQQLDQHHLSPTTILMQDFGQHPLVHPSLKQALMSSDTKQDSGYDPDEFEAEEVDFFTDEPRNQSTVNMAAARWEEILTEYKLQKVGVTDAIWMPITGAAETKAKGGFVYSAFLDNRWDPPVVLVLGNTPKRTTRKLFCRFHHQNHAQQSELGSPSSKGAYQAGALLPKSTVEAWVEPQSPGLVDKYPVMAVFIRCPLFWDKDQLQMGHQKLKIPASVSIYPDEDSAKNCHGTGNNILINKRGKEKWEAAGKSYMYGPKLTYCVQHLFRNYDDTVQLVEFLELYSILGVSLFHMYGHSYSPQVHCILKEHYSKEESTINIKLHNWELPLIVDADVREGDPETGMNDCLYRSLVSGDTYVANGDLDDMLMPYTHSGPGALLSFLVSAVNAHPTAGVFSFSRKQFARQYADDKAYRQSLLKETDEVPLRPMRKTRVQSYRDSLAPKVVVIPERVVGLETHAARALMPGYHKVVIHKSIATAHHYRLDGEPESLDKLLVVDKSVHVYRKLLSQKIQQFLQVVPKVCNVTRDLWASDTP